MSVQIFFEIIYLIVLGGNRGWYYIMVVKK